MKKIERDDFDCSCGECDTCILEERDRWNNAHEAAELQKEATMRLVAWKKVLARVSDDVDTLDTEKLESLANQLKAARQEGDNHSICALALDLAAAAMAIYMDRQGRS